MREEEQRVLIGPLCVIDDHQPWFVLGEAFHQPGQAMEHGGLVHLSGLSAQDVVDGGLRWSWGKPDPLSLRTFPECPVEELADDPEGCLVLQLASGGPPRRGLLGGRGQLAEEGCLPEARRPRVQDQPAPARASETQHRPEFVDSVFSLEEPSSRVHGSQSHRRALWWSTVGLGDPAGRE